MVIFALRWLALEHPAGAHAYARILLGAVTGLVGAIAARTIVAGLRGQLLPSTPGVHVKKTSTALAGPAPVSR
jgi:tellurite resistance protein